jgi:adhesin/invasin
VTDNGDGTYTATLTSTATGTADVSGTINGNTITSGDASVEFTPGIASGSTSTISANSTSITADGSSTSTITVQAVDANGNDETAGGDAVTLTTTKGTISGVTDNTDGTYTATLTSPTTTGTADVSGTINGNTITSGDASVAFTPGAVSAANSTISANPTSIAADGTSTSTITVQAVDANGNDETAGGATVLLDTNAGSLSGVTDNGDGTYTATLTSSTTAETADVSGAIDGNRITSGNASVTFTPPGAVSAAQSTISPGPQSITADGTSTSNITVQAVDANGNDETSGAATVALSTTTGTLSGIADNGDGTYSATLTSSTTAGTADVSGTIDGNAITSGDASVTFLAQPTATIIAPTSGGTYSQSQAVAAAFSCTDAAGGPGVASCADNNGHSGGTGTITGSLATGTLGNQTYVVTATSQDGMTGTTSLDYTVIAALAHTNPSAITGTAAAGKTLTCSPGTWAGNPTFSYLWSRDGTPIPGATGPTYTVQSVDEGTTLTCTVTAADAAGATQSATPASIDVPVRQAAQCPAATGRLTGTQLGQVSLGMTRRQAQAAYADSSDRGDAYQDFFCLTPSGIRGGFASPDLLATLSAGRRSTYAGRVVWVSTSNVYYAIDGIRSGATLKAAARRLKLGKVFMIGANAWYLASAGPATAILKVRDGIVQEIGIGEASLTRTRAEQRTFLTSFS